MLTAKGALTLSERQQIMANLNNLNAVQVELEKAWREDLLTIREACLSYNIRPVRILHYQELYFLRCTAIKTEDRPGWQWQDVRVEAVADVLEAILEDLFPVTKERAA